MEVKNLTFTVKPDGRKIAATIYKPENAPLGLIEIVHGMSEYRKRYDKICRLFCENGFFTVIHDQRGHGESATDELHQGFFAEEKGWDMLINDVSEIGACVKKEYAITGVPTVLLGHSMGTLVSRCYLQKHADDIDALVLTGAPNPNPAVKVGKALADMICKAKGKLYRSPLLSAMVFGSFNKKIESPKTEFDWLSKNEENVKNYIDDPLCGFMFTAKGYSDMFEGIIRMANPKNYTVNKPDLPILFAAGEFDPCTGGEKGLNASIKILEDAGYKNIMKTVYDGLRHEIFNEDEWESIVRDIVFWIKKELSIEESEGTALGGEVNCGE